MNSNTLIGFEKFVAGSLDVNGETSEAWSVIKECFDSFAVENSSFEDTKRRIEKNLKEIQNLKDDEFAEYLDKAVKYIAKKDRNRIFEGLIFVILSDKVLSFEECEFIADVAELFEIDTALLIARIAFNIQEEDVMVDVEDELTNIE